MIFRVFKKLEKGTRTWLSRRPMLYALVGGVGVVLFWRGVWHITDFLAASFLSWHGGMTSIDYFQGIDSLISLLVGCLLLLSTGLFVAEFISGEVLISGLKGEKLVSEKTEQEIKQEEGELKRIEAEIDQIARKVEEIDGEIDLLTNEKK